MKEKKENFAFFLPLLFCVCFIGVRFFLKCFDCLLYETDLRGIAILSSSFPFGILKEQLSNGFLFSFYHFLTHIFSYFNFSDKILIYRIFNTIISLLCAGVLFNIAYKMKKFWMGIFLILYLALNHYFIYFSNQVTPFCLNCLMFLLVIFHFLNFLNFENGFNKKGLKYFLIICAIYCLCDNLGILFVFGLFLILYLILKNKKRFLIEYVKELKKYSYFYLILSIILIIQLVCMNSKLITCYINNIAINFNSFYLFINEFFSPYLSFNSQEAVKQSTLGMLYTYFLNPDIKNLNSFKILITLFYSSFLPCFLFLIFSLKAVLKNSKLRILFLAGVANLIILFILFAFNYLEFSPKYAYQFFFIALLAFLWGLFEIKDIYIKSIAVFCLLLIQLIVPEIHSYSILINKNAPVINAFEKFKTDYNITPDDLIIMPYSGRSAKKYYKKLNFFDFDYDDLRQRGKNDFLAELIKKNEPLNKKNIYFLTKDYLFSNAQNEFLAKYFIENCAKDDLMPSRIVLAVDKLNQRILSPVAINKFAANTEFNLALRQIDFKSNILLQNSSCVLYNALISRTLYNIASLLNENFYPKEIVQYKRVQNTYYKIFNNTLDIYTPLISPASDYVFIIFTKRVI